jgi:flagellar biosynthesis GTPase FlhF
MGKYKIDPGKRKEFTDFSKEYVDTLKNAGYDFDLVKNQVRELAKEKEALKGEKKEAQNLRLLEAGLGILGGESPYAFVNIGKGATPALQGLAKDLKEIKKTSRQLDKETMQLNLLQNQMAEGKVKYSQDRLDKQEDRFQRIVEKDMDNRLSLAKTLVSSNFCD